MSQFNRCQFGTCQSDGIDRTIAFISKANKRVTVRPILCDKHHRAAMEGLAPNSPRGHELKSSFDPAALASLVFTEMLVIVTV
jgi:hypothetical protein